MSCSRKRPRIATIGGANGEDGTEEVCDNRGIGAVAEPADVFSSTTATADDFSSDVLPIILSYLKLRDIMPARFVCKKWTDAVRKTPVSPEEIFVVDSVKTYNALTVMSTVLPNLQSVKIEYFTPFNHKYNDGEDPDEEYAAATADYTAYDIGIVSAFRKLCRLEIDCAPLNGRYPFLFNSFPLLQKLSIQWCNYLKWDLEMLVGLPMLKELECCGNSKLTGNINSLRVLKDKLEKVTLGSCANVEGNFMDLADFPQLKTLKLYSTDITVDIQDIGNQDFSKMEELVLGRNLSVNGNIRSLRVLKDTLQKLVLNDCPNVEGNFMALSDFPQLKSVKLSNTAVTVDIGDIGENDFSKLEDIWLHFYLPVNRSLSHSVTGNITSLRVLKDTLEKIQIWNCPNVEGNFMDLADFPRLRSLRLESTAVTGDIRDIGKDDFSKIEQLDLPSTIYGGDGYELQRISDAPELMRTLYLLKKQHPSLTFEDWHGRLSDDSPDWYDWDEEMNEDGVSPPFWISFVEAGTRIGYRWENCEDDSNYCEVNWLDPEPDKDNSDYAKYIEELQEIEEYYKPDFYEGYHQPPSQEEYNRLVDEWRLER